MHIISIPLAAILHSRIFHYSHLTYIYLDAYNTVIVDYILLNWKRQFLAKLAYAYKVIYAPFKVYPTDLIWNYF